MKILIYQKYLPIAYLIFLIFIFFNRIYLEESNISIFLSVLFIALCFFSFQLFLIENKKKNYLPFFPLIIFYFLITYGFSFELIEGFIQNKSEKVINKTFIILNLGIIFLNLGYFTNIKIFKMNRSGFKYLEVKKYNQIVLIAMFFLSINFLNKFFNFIPPNLNQIIFPLIFIGCSILFYSIIKIKDFKNYLYFIVILLTVFLEILSSSYVFPATLVTIYFVIYFNVKRKIPVVTILLFIIFFFTLHLHKNDLRKNLIKITNDHPFERSKVIFNLYSNKINFEKDKDIILEDIYFESTFTEESKRKELNYWRLAHSFSSLVILIEKTPSEIDYLNGETYKILYAKFIPRILWPSKPNDDLANKIGRKYKVLSKNDFTTSWNLPILNEAYINYGFLGVTLIMFILGFLVRLFTNFFSVTNYNNAESHIGVYLCCSTFFWEPHLSLVYGGKYYPILFLYFTMAVLIFFLNRFIK